MSKLRLRFAKKGKAVYISHLDLMRTMQRAFLRAGYPLKYSEGFNPIPHLVFSPPLSVGCGGVDEALDFKLVTDVPDAEIFEKLRAAMPDGISVSRVYTQDMKLKTIAWAENVIDFNGGVAGLSGIEEVETLFDSPVVMMKRSKSGEKEVDISPLV